MMEIGANTPAMIKAMTTEGESKNFIVASMHLCVESSLAGALPPSAVRSCLPLHLPRANSLPLHARPHDWQRSSSRIGTSNPKK
jgi:hypothetical protein